MKVSIVLVAVGILLSAASGQWLETTIEVGHPPSAVCYNTQDNKLYYRSPTESLGLLVIDGARNTITDTVPVPQMGRPGQGCELCYSPVGNEVYWAVAVFRELGYLFAVDGSSNVVIDTAVLDNTTPQYHSPTNNKLYATHVPAMMTTVWVYVFDCATLEMVAYIYAGDWSIAQVLCHNPADNKVYVSVYGADNYLMIIDGVGDSLLGRLPTASGGRSACYSPLGRVYVGRGSSVCVVDAAGDSVLRTIPVPGGAQLTCYDSIDAKLYCGR